MKCPLCLSPTLEESVCSSCGYDVVQGRAQANAEIEKRKEMGKKFTRVTQTALIVLGVICIILSLLRPPYYFTKTVRTMARDRSMQISNESLSWRAHFWIWAPPEGKYSDAYFQNYSETPYLDASRLSVYIAIGLTLILCGWLWRRSS